MDSEPTNVVFLTDARSVLEALESDKLPKMEMELDKLKMKWSGRIVLQWIPSHCGVDSNERADRLAKEGAAAEQSPDSTITYHEKRTIIKAIKRADPLPKDDYHALDRNQQVIIFRLRTGHNRLRSHLFGKFKIGTSGGCDCGSPKQDTEHVLQQCSSLQKNRSKDWPINGTSLETKLYGALLSF